MSTPTTEPVAPPTTWNDLIGNDPCIQDSNGFWTTLQYAIPCTPPTPETTVPAYVGGELPHTGMEGTVAALALAACVLGATLVRLARR